MKIAHPAMRSDVFRLVATYEFDLQIGACFHPTRIELFRDTQRTRRWRARLWDLELCRIEASPVDQLPEGAARKKGTRKAREVFDEETLLERTWMLGDDLSDFTAASEAAALRRVLDALAEHLGPATPAAR